MQQSGKYTAESSEENNNRINGEELQMLLLLSEINLLALRPDISEVQLQRLESLIKTWQILSLRLHPTLKQTRNLHQLVHIPADIRLHGPAPGVSCFAGERYGKALKHINTNKIQIESSLIHQRIKAAHASRAMSELFHSANNPSETQAANDLLSNHRQSIRKDSNQVTSTNTLLESFKADTDIVKESAKYLAFFRPNKEEITYGRASHVTIPGHHMRAILAHFSRLQGKDWRHHLDPATFAPDYAGIHVDEIATAYDSIAVGRKRWRNWHISDGKLEAYAGALQVDSMAIHRPAWEIYHDKHNTCMLEAIAGVYTLDVWEKGTDRRQIKVVLTCHGIPASSDHGYPYKMQ